MEEITNSVNTESISEATVNAGSVENATETVKNADLEGNSNTETAENTDEVRQGEIHGTRQVCRHHGQA